MNVSNSILIDVDSARQIFRGWGTSLCWWANVVGRWKDEGNIDEICRLLFSEKDGLGISSVRYNLGAGENPPGRSDFRYGADLPCVMAPDGTWDMDADRAQTAILMKAVRLGADHVEVFLNSPPRHMTVSGSTAGGEDGSCNLREDSLDQLADFLVTACQKLSEKYGIRIDTLAPFNEPMSFWWKKDNNQEGCHFSVTEQSVLIEKIATILEERKIHIGLSAPECWSTYETVYALRHYSPVALGKVAEINTHSYFSDEQSRKELATIGERLGKPIWMSEVSCGGNRAHSHSDMSSALELASNITVHINQMRASGWVYWQAVENELLQHNHGLIQTEFGKDEVFHLTKQYHVFAEYSRYIRPGYRILDSGHSESVLAALSPDNRYLVIAICNVTAAPVRWELSVPDSYRHDSVECATTSSQCDFELSVQPYPDTVTVDAESVKTLRFKCSENR